jgi:hypothetical protein
MSVRRKLVRKLEKEAIRFLLPTASSNQPRQRFHSIEKRVETLVAHPLETTFPLTSRTSFVAVDVE